MTIKLKVLTFNKGEVLVDPEANKDAPFLKRINYTECPVCDKLVEQDLLYHSPQMSGFTFACGHSAHFKAGEEPVYE